MRQREILLTGRLGLLAAHLAARLLRDSVDRVACVAGPSRFDELVLHAQRAARQLAAGEAEDPAPRIEASLRRADLTAAAPEAEVWHFADTAGSDAGGPDDAVQAALREAGVSDLTLVRTPYAAGSAWPLPATDGAAAADGAASPLRFRRTFTTSWTLAPVAPHGAAREGLLHLLATLFEVQSEMEERLPDYFDYRALRCLAPVGAQVGVLRVEQAAELIARIAAGSAAGDFQIAAPRGEDLELLFERVGAVYGISLLAEPDEEQLNAVDAAFTRRLGALDGRLGAADPEAVEASCRAAETSSADLVLSEDELEELLDGVRAAQRLRRSALRRAADGIEATLEREELERGGHPLTYLSTSSGEPAVVLVNALGQGLGYWSRLIEALRARRRVLIWNLRGILSPPAACRIPDHVDDLEAILDHAGVNQAHLVAWCTGPRIAVELYNRRPRTVSSMVFLNTTLKCTDGPAHLDTDYERNFEPLCRVLDGRPAMAESITSSLLANAAGGDLDADRGLELLESVPAALRTEVRRPFQDAGSVLSYTRQLRDFWQHDLRTIVGEVAAPVLCIAAEHDRIAEPEASRTLASLLPRGRWLAAAGASHYLLHDRAESLADLLESFFENPEGVGVRPPAQEPADLVAAGGGEQLESPAGSP